jgi:hypothetical protein
LHITPKKKRQVSKGTGKRYESDKPKPQAIPIRTAPPPASYAEKALRNSISSFGLSKRFREDLERAIEQYMGPGAIQKQGDKNIIVLDENDKRLPGFQEWFYFDYVLPSGQHIIDLFVQEEGQQLNATQRKILNDWLATNRLHLLETQSVEPGIGETMQDLLSGEIFHLNDISYSYQGSRWMVFLGRTILTEGRWSFTGSGSTFTPLEKPELLNIAKELWVQYQQEHPQADLLDFYRDHSLDLYLAGQEILNESRKPKEVFTAEGHAALNARAKFTIQGESRHVENTLDQSDEFVYINEQKTGEFSGCLHYIWLLRGRSSVPEAPDPTKGLKMTGSWTRGPGEPDFRTLGDLYLCSQKLALLCLSSERLEAGKDLLRRILGNKIKHQEDQFADLETTTAEKDRKDEGRFGDGEDRSKTETQNAELKLVAEEAIERITLRWLDTPGPAGLTPRQLAQTPEGRVQLQEMMKSQEFIEDQAIKSGKRPPMRLDIVRKELRL